MSMGGGKDGGGGAEGMFGQELAATTKEIREMSRPVRAETYAQTLEALKTGGVGARIPMIQRAVEGSRVATSNALQQITESLASSGLKNTPFGQRTLAEVRTKGAAREADIPTQIAAAMAGFAPQLTQGAEKTTVAGYGTGYGAAAQAGAARYGSEMSLLGEIFGALIGGGGKIGAAWAGA